MRGHFGDVVYRARANGDERGSAGQVRVECGDGGVGGRRLGRFYYMRASGNAGLLGACGLLLDP